MLTGGRTGTALKAQLSVFHRVQPDCHCSTVQMKAKKVLVQTYIFHDINVLFAARPYQGLTLGAQEFACLPVGKMRKLVLECDHDGFSLFHRISSPLQKTRKGMFADRDFFLPSLAPDFNRILPRLSDRHSTNPSPCPPIFSLSRSHP